MSKWLAALMVSATIIIASYQYIVTPGQNDLMQEVLQSSVLNTFARDAMPVPDWEPLTLTKKKAVDLICLGEKNCLLDDENTPLPPEVDVQQTARALQQIREHQTKWLTQVERFDVAHQIAPTRAGIDYLINWQKPLPTPNRLFVVQSTATNPENNRVRLYPQDSVLPTAKSIREAGLAISGQRVVEVFRDDHYEKQLQKVVCVKNLSQLCPAAIQIFDMQQNQKRAEATLIFLRNWPISFLLNAIVLTISAAIFSRSPIATVLMALAASSLSFQSINHLFELDPSGLKNRFLPYNQWSISGSAGLHSFDISMIGNAFQLYVLPPTVIFIVAALLTCALRKSPILNGFFYQLKWTTTAILGVLSTLIVLVLISNGFNAAASEVAILLAAATLALPMALYPDQNISGYDLRHKLILSTVMIGLIIGSLLILQGDAGHGVLAISVSLIYLALWLEQKVFWSALCLLMLLFIVAALLTPHNVEIPDSRGIQRLTAMQDPANALLSDLYRVLSVQETSRDYDQVPPFGYLGTGSGLPYQAISDYTQSLISARFGLISSLMISATVTFLTFATGLMLVNKLNPLQPRVILWLRSLSALAFITYAFRGLISLAGGIGAVPLTGVSLSALFSHAPIGMAAFFLVSGIAAAVMTDDGEQ